MRLCTLIRKKPGLLAVLVLVWLFMLPSRTFAQTTFSISQPNASTFYGNFLGFGAEWDPFFFNTNNINRGLTEADWQLVTQRIKELDVGIVRMMMQLSWATGDPNLGSWRWDSAQMKSVFRYLDYACQNNIDVILTDWGWSVRRELYSSPTDYRFAQGVATYLDEFINKRGYTCIKYLVIGNEPDNEIAKDFGNAAYATMYENVDRALREKGIRGKVKLTGPDMGGDWDFMKDTIGRIKGVVDTYDFHRYASTNETANTNLPGTWESLWSHLDLWRGEVNSRDSNAASKQLLLTEMGNSGGGTNTHPNIDTFEYALHMADYGTTLLTTRVNTGIAWEMFDIYYFDGGQFMQWGMWKYKNDNWKIRPWGQAFGLLIKHAPKGSVQAAVNGTPPSTPPLSTIRVAAVKRPDGGWSLFLVNRNSSTSSIQLNLPSAPTRNFNVYRFDSSTNINYPNTIALSPISTTQLSQNNSLNLPPLSFTVLVENVSTGPTPTPTGSSKPGDANGDNKVDGLDYTRWLNNYNTSKAGAANGDFNNNGVVDGVDYTIWLNNYGR